jgi:Flp pilus assembly protein TadB
MEEWRALMAANPNVQVGHSGGNRSAEYRGQPRRLGQPGSGEMTNLLRFLIVWMLVGAPVVVLVGATWNTMLRGPVLVALLLAGVTVVCVIARDNRRWWREWSERYRNQHPGRHSE